MTHLILDGRDQSEWQRHHSGGLLIPQSDRPTVLQADRVTAEKEALRLAQNFPSGVFVVFAPVAIAKRLPEVTHVNLKGQPVQYRNVARLIPVLRLDDDMDIPF